MIIELDYGGEKLKVDIPEKNISEIISCEPVAHLDDPFKSMMGSFSGPIGSDSLANKIKNKKNICIVISDITRAVPTRFILETLLPYLHENGIAKDCITILVATGLHRPNIGKELISLVGAEIAQSYRVVNHNARSLEDCVNIGKTNRGTPIIINKNFVNADFKILTGLIEPHFMAGFSGGRKAICPGISYMDMFKHFHGPAILESSNAAFGILENNPFHEESTEIAKKAGVDFIVNVTINKEKQITGIFSGDLEKAFLEGAKFCRKSSSYKVKKEADIVLTSGGGLPLDATLYQVVKGIVGAIPAVKKGGLIITAAECSEEIGSKEFVEIIQQEADTDAFMEKINSKDYFKIDQWEYEELIKARRKADIFLYSSCILPGTGTIPSSTLRLVRSVEDAIRIGFEKYGKDATISVIPEGPYTIVCKP
jgi:lactate racemase